MATTPQQSELTPPAEDRRSSPRRKIEQVIYVNFGPDNGGILLDISEGGLSCRVVGALFKGESCRPKFMLPGDTLPIEGDCFVAWTTPSKKCGGLQFTDLSEDAQGRIRQWIAQQQSTVAARTVVMTTRMNPIVLGNEARTLSTAPAQGEIEPTATIDEPVANEPVLIQPLPVSPPATEAQNSPADNYSNGHLELDHKPASQRVFISSTSQTLFPLGIHAQDKPRIVPPVPPRVRVSAAWIVTCLCFLAATLVVAFYFGRLAGISSEAARMVRANPASSSVEPVRTAIADPAPTPRNPEPALADAAPAKPPQPDEIANPPVAVAAPPPEVPAAQSARKSDVDSHPLASAPHASPRIKSMNPPRPERRLDADSKAAALPDIALTNPSPIDPVALSIDTLGGSVPAQPHPATLAPSTAFRGPVLIQRVEPAYSPLAKETGVEGSVEVKAIIGKDGVPRALGVIRGDPRLSESALNAVRKWRYQPAVSDGNAVEAPVTITIQFRLHQ
jgi:protein TonB